jgi:PAS domain-containing protein
MIAMPSVLARRILDAAPQAMVILDTFGTLWSTNRQVTALFGYAHEEIIGESIEKLMAERFRAQHAEHRGHFVSSVRVRSGGTGLDLRSKHSARLLDCSALCSTSASSKPQRSNRSRPISR